jgi:hypothetical protein
MCCDHVLEFGDVLTPCSLPAAGGPGMQSMHCCCQGLPATASGAGQVVGVRGRPSIARICAHGMLPAVLDKQ